MRDRRRQAGGRWGRRQVIMPLMSWAAHVLQWPAQWAATARAGANPQSRPQFGLEAATRLHEVGVASNRGSARRGECVPGPCTHRPSHHPSRLHPKSSAQPAREGGAEGVEGKGGEVVTRYPYENVRMDHLLSRENNLSRENDSITFSVRAASRRIPQACLSPRPGARSVRSRGLALAVP